MKVTEENAKTVDLSAYFEQWRPMENRGVAEREGFEPPIPLRVCRISSAVLSTTQPPLRSPKRAKNGREWTALSNQARQDRQGLCGVYCHRGQPGVAREGYVQ